ILKKMLHTGEEEGELLDIVLRESRRLDRIIKDFLLFAKPGRFHPQISDLVPILTDALTLLRNSEEFGPAHSVKTVFESERIPAFVDENRIRQVFWNLAKNALKAMPSGGELAV